MTAASSVAAAAALQVKAFLSFQSFLCELEIWQIIFAVLHSRRQGTTGCSSVVTAFRKENKLYAAKTPCPVLPVIRKSVTKSWNKTAMKAPTRICCSFQMHSDEMKDLFPFVYLGVNLIRWNLIFRWGNLRVVKYIFNLIDITRVQWRFLSVFGFCYGAAIASAYVGGASSWKRTSGATAIPCVEKWLEHSTGISQFKVGPSQASSDSLEAGSCLANLKWKIILLLGFKLQSLTKWSELSQEQSEVAEQEERWRKCRSQIEDC